MREGIWYNGVVARGEGAGGGPPAQPPFPQVYCTAPNWLDTSCTYSAPVHALADTRMHAAMHTIIMWWQCVYSEVQAQHNSKTMRSNCKGIQSFALCKIQGKCWCQWCWWWLPWDYWMPLCHPCSSTCWHLECQECVDNNYIHMLADVSFKNENTSCI